MTNFAKKLQIGTAGCAIAAATALVQLPTAQAAPAVAPPAAPVTHVLDNLPQVDFWWLFSNNPDPGPAAPSTSSLLIGPQNPNPPLRTTFLSFQPLTLLPGFIQPFFGWFQGLNFEVCVAGVSARVGPYGTVSASIGQGC
ncbi:MAG: hypothetical protein JWR34_4762 [Mycobacterium sp.]|jgi:hypothetical protein|nr:hypothetical protein [Mycobacterium sp.]